MPRFCVDCGVEVDEGDEMCYECEQDYYDDDTEEDEEQI